MEPLERNNSTGDKTDVYRGEEFVHKVERCGTVMREKGPISEQVNSKENSPEQQTQGQVHELPSLQGPVPEALGDGTLVGALKELEIKDPDKFYEECCDDVKKLRKRGVFGRYILNSEEAATVCAAFRLMRSGFCFDKVFEVKKLNKFGIAILVSIRKLPVYKGKLCHYHKFNALIKRKEGEDIIWAFYFTSKSVTIAEEFLCSGNSTGELKEMLFIEEGWGYDVSDFVGADYNDEAEETQSKFVSFFVFMIHLFCLN